MRTIWWNSNNRTVQMIDQRLLPHRLELPEFADYRAVAAAIHNMTIRGAPAIGAGAGAGQSSERCGYCYSTKSCA